MAPAGVGEDAGAGAGIGLVGLGEGEVRLLLEGGDGEGVGDRVVTIGVAEVMGVGYKVWTYEIVPQPKYVNSAAGKT
jgi:hypothetical protein